MRGGLLQLHGALTVHQTSVSAWLPWRWENALEWETWLLHILCQVFVQIGWESRFVSQKQLGITEINIFNTSFLLKLVLVKQSDQVHTADIDQPLIISSFFCLHWENDNNKRAWEFISGNVFTPLVTTDEFIQFIQRYYRHTNTGALTTSPRLAFGSSRLKGERIYSWIIEQIKVPGSVFTWLLMMPLEIGT